MARKEIYVLSHGTRWKVQCDHCTLEEIKDTQTEAIKAAKKHVEGLSAGTLSQIRVQGTDGKWRTEWTYGKDPFPPPG
jgi:Uncharacterized protein conserved in bacteria (DUF2188)